MRDELQLLKDRVDLLDLKNQDLEIRIAKKVGSATCEHPDPSGMIRDLESRLMSLISQQGKDIALEFIQLKKIDFDEVAN